MAKVGLKYPVAAMLKDDESGYEKGFVIAKAIKATANPNNNSAVLYADDGQAESDKSIRDISISLNVDDLTQKVYADLLGHTYTAAGEGPDGTPEKVEVSTDDIAPFVGIGFYGKVVRSNKPSYMAKWLKKVQFAEPNDETDTKGESVNFQTPTIEGTAYACEDGSIKEQAEFTTEAEAIKWLKTKIGMTE